MSGAQELIRALARHPTIHSYQVEHNGKIAGEVLIKQNPLGGKYLFAEREERHFYVKRQSLGVDAKIWRDALTQGIGSVIFVYHGRNGLTIYRSKLSDWRSYGIPIMEHRDWEPQIQLPVKHMEILEAEA